MGAAIEDGADVRFSSQCGSVTTTWLNIEMDHATLWRHNQASRESNPVRAQEAG
jgi:hypothetical protein